jgi:hypothetical protein
MQGYRRKAYRLTFEDEQFEGLYVRCRPASIAMMERLMGLADVDIKRMSATDARDVLGEICEAFGPAIIEWNFEVETESGEYEVAPVGAEGLRLVDPDMLIAMVEAYMTAVMGVSGPLSRPSRDGASSVEGSIPMEPLSESRESLLAPSES